MPVSTIVSGKKKSIISTAFQQVMCRRVALKRLIGLHLVLTVQRNCHWFCLSQATVASLSQRGGLRCRLELGLTWSAGITCSCACGA